jgi:hypothetical protein
MTTANEGLLKRGVARLLGQRIPEFMAAQADRHGVDLIDTLIFTIIWATNTEHLVVPGRYAGIFDIPPNAERRPIKLAELTFRARLPKTLVAERVAGLKSRHMVEETPAGLIVPSAVFTQPEMLNGVDAIFENARQLVEELAQFGVVAQGRKSAA